MQKIPYEVQDTMFAMGNGLFAKENISKGTCIWKYMPGISVLEYNAEKAKAHLESMKTLSEQQNWLDMTYGLHGILVEIIDDGRYMNHSETPNCKTDEKGDVYTLKDIYQGQQLLEDYTSFDHPDFLFGLLEKYECAPDYYELPSIDDAAKINTLNENNSLFSRVQ